MKVAVWHNLPSGGAKRALHDQVRGLKALGHTVEAWCAPTANREFLPLADLVHEHVLPFGDVSLSRRMHWFSGRAGISLEIIGRLQAMQGHARLFAAALRERDFDVVLAAPCRWFHVPAITDGLPIPAALYLQEPYRDLYEARPLLPWVADDRIPVDARDFRDFRRIIGQGLRLHPLRLQAREELRHARAFHLILVNSRFSRESVLRAYGLDATVCYLGVDTRLFANYCGPREPRVMSVGQFSAHKNPEALIRAVARSRTRPALRWIANDVTPGYPQQMLELATQLGVTLEIKVGIPDADLVREYQRNAVMLYAPRLEPFGFAPLEANACGMPVIAVAEGGVRETVIADENGILVDSASQLSDALDRLLDRPEEARRLGQNGAAIVRRHWTTEAAARRLEQHLLGLAGGDTAAPGSPATRSPRGPRPGVD